MSSEPTREVLARAIFGAITFNVPVDGFGQAKRLNEYAAIWGNAGADAVLALRLAEAGPTLLQLVDADALREHLDMLNENGVDDKAAGVDALGQPFLITLAGGYAEGMVALIDDPRDTFNPTGRDGQRCDACGTVLRALDAVELHFPVTVLVRRTS